MENNQLVSIVDYLRLGSTIHEEHLNTIRDMYNELINQMSIDINELNSPDEIIITEIIRRLKIRDDTDETLEYLCDCVRYTAKMVINGRILGAVEPLDETISGTGSTALPPQLLSVPSVDLTENETILDRINCVLNIKMMVPEVQKFIHLFLLQEIDKPGNIVTT
jgi:hypothetical protein